MKRMELSILIGLAASILIASFTAFAQECDEVRHSVVRLHVLANSDSEEDQGNKLFVRDAVLLETGEVFALSRDKEQAKRRAQENIGLIERTAREALKAQGCDMPVRVEIVEDMFFETRQYGDVTLPAGKYDAVRIVIGEGAGRNWWCVLFPPMCVPAAIEQQDAALTGQIERLGSDPVYKPKFAVVELWEKLMDTLQTEEGGPPPSRSGH